MNESNVRGTVRQNTSEGGTIMDLGMGIDPMGEAEAYAVTDRMIAAVWDGRPVAASALAEMGDRGASGEMAAADLADAIRALPPAGTRHDG